MVPEAGVEEELVAAVLELASRVFEQADRRRVAATASVREDLINKFDVFIGRGISIRDD